MQLVIVKQLFLGLFLFGTIGGKNKIRQNMRPQNTKKLVQVNRLHAIISVKNLIWVDICIWRYW